MKIEIYRENALCIVRPSGRIDLATLAEFESSLRELLETAPPKLLIDMGKVTYLAGAGLGVLLATATYLRGHASQMGVFGVSGRVREVFEVSGFASVLNVHADEMSARGEVS
ncbi:STAS domain-containing protein [uncultured Roseibium sp.]|uniref:STAS domain-containing protein n=1 Tax=uncultured Roseibium sp. TaxID=1936171 RepID=UPI00263A3BAD|nr:STAS domain-containing protein [uncultured Roseibium sp.]